MTAGTPAAPQDVDPFDLPDELGSGEVVWSADDGLACGYRVRGTLLPASGTPVACDLLAVDEAYPVPVAEDALRLRAHQAWRHGQVHLASYDGRLTILVPGTAFTADDALEAVARLAKSLGSAPSNFSVRLRLGS